MFVVDTNVLVYASNEDCPEHEVCLALLNGWRHSGLPWYLTWSIVYEFLRIVTHPRVMARPWDVANAWSFVRALTASPSLGLLTATDMHDRILGKTLAEHPHLRGNLVPDVHTVVLMREHGIRRIYTRDADFHRFSSVEVIDPMEPERP